MLKKVTTVILASIVSASSQADIQATPNTIEDNQLVLKALPFNNKQSFNDAQRGFIAPLANQGIVKEGSLIVWDLPKFEFIKQDMAAPDTVNPSLWRQAQLLMYSGLFKVVEGIYQVRSLDLSNMTIIEAPEGLIIVDPLISKETASAALALYYAHRPKKPVKVVIYTHSHIDHYGGVKGVTSEADVKSGKVKVVAPVGFVDSALSENVIVGNVMSRRASYMYGNILPATPFGQVGAGLGLTTSSGTVTFIAPSLVIKKNGQQENLAGLDFEFLLAHGSEAPAEMHFYIPKYKALTAAENASHTLHNLYSLRGAKVRDAKAWAYYLNETIDKWGDKAQVVYGMHHWPIWGNTELVDYLKKQRDAYKYIHDQTLRLANQGYDMTEIAEKIKLPPSLSNNWSTRGYYGSVNHDVKAVYNYYLGWFNGNPATLHPLPRVEASKKYVEFMGGSKSVLAKAQKAYNNGEYRWVAQVVNHVIYAEPSNQAARQLQAKALAQLGYIAESGPWRNFYLSGAQELTKGVQKEGIPDTASVDTIRAMPMAMLFDLMAVKLNGPKAVGKKITINMQLIDTKKNYTLNLENAVLNYSMNKLAEKPDLTIKLNRSALNNILLKQSTLAEEVKQGKIIFVGDRAKLTELLRLLDDFKLWFNLVTPINSK